MDFRLRRQSLLERAKHVEEEARRVKNAQAQDVMRALALLYRGRWQKNSKIAGCSNAVSLPCTLLFLVALGVFFYYLLRKCALRLNRNEGGTLMPWALG